MTTKATKAENGVESVDEKRARFERFQFTVCANGVVNVRNDSYGDDSGAHIYSVRVENGAATGCSCPHHVHRGAHCKHQQAVENRPIVVSSATALASNPVATDGGTDDDRFRLPEDPEHEDEPDTVDVSPCLGCGSLTQHETCGRDRCEGAGEVNDTPL